MEAATGDLSVTLRQAILSLIDAIRNPHLQPPIPEDFTNEDVLGAPATPIPPTLHEIHNANPRSWWLSLNVEKTHSWQDFFIYTRNFAFLKEMRHAAEFHGNLPPISQGKYDVWVLCRRRGTAIEIARHWTVLTQGRIFHLRAPKKKVTNLPAQTGIALDDVSNMSILRKLLAKTKFKTPIEYEDLDFSNAGSEHSLKEHKNRKKFIAYHVGKTIYTAAQVERIAKAVMKQMQHNGMGSYDFLDNNCQHFVLSLVRRIVMTQRKPMAVGGTRLQLAQWDMGFDGYRIVEWLTPMKARLLFRPTSYSKKFPKRNLILTTLSPGFIHFADTIPKFLGSVQDVLSSKDKLAELKTQYKTRWKSHQWKKHDKWTWLGWFALFVLICGFGEVAILIGSYQMSSAAAAGLSASSLTTMIAGLQYEDIFGSFVMIYLILTKFLFTRGSLTIKHYDIKRTKPGSYETARAEYSTPWYHTDEEKQKNGIDITVRELGSESDSDVESGSGSDDGDHERLYPLNRQYLESLEPVPMDDAEGGIGDDDQHTTPGNVPLSPPPPYESDDDERPPLPVRLPPLPARKPALPPRRPVLLPV